MNYFKTTISSVVLFLFTVTASTQAIPPLVNYQGRLMDSGGMPVTGSVPATFALWDSPSGGTQLWTESKAVEVSNGIYSVLLGDSVAIPTSVFSGSTVYLEVTVMGETLAPREHLTTVPYAFHAGDADSLGGIAASSYAQVGNIDFSQLTGTATDAQIPDNITINLAQNSAQLNGLPADAYVLVAGDTVTGDLQVNGALTGLGTLTVGSDLYVLTGRIGLGITPSAGYGILNSSASPPNYGASLYGSVNGIRGAWSSLPDNTYGILGQDGSGVTGFAGTSSSPTEQYGGNFNSSSNSTAYGVSGLAYSYGTNAAIGSRGYANAISTGNAMGGEFTTDPAGTGTHYAVYATGISASNSPAYASYNYGANTSTGDAYGGYFSTSPAGTGAHYGIYAASDGSTTGEEYGIFGSGQNSGLGLSYGGRFISQIAGSGDHYGASGLSYSESNGGAIGLDGYALSTGSGYAMGGEFTADPAGTGVHYAVYATGISASNSPAYGSYNHAANTSTGDAYGGYFSTSPAGTGAHYGIYAASDGSTTGEEYGVFGSGQNSGLGLSYGGRFISQIAGSGDHYGASGLSYSESNGGAIGLDGYALATGAGYAMGGEFTSDPAGTGTHYGVYATGISASNSPAYASYNHGANTSTGDAYGGYFSTSPAGTGTHYGLYAASDGGTSGDSYGVYGSAQNSIGPSYGGYFTAQTGGFGPHYGVFGTASDYAGFFQWLTDPSNHYTYIASGSEGIFVNAGSPSDAGSNYGGVFLVRSTASAFGTEANAYSYGSSDAMGARTFASNSSTGDAYGGYFRADTAGTGTHYGVYGEANDFGVYGQSVTYGIYGAWSNDLNNNFGFIGSQYYGVYGSAGSSNQANPQFGGAFYASSQSSSYGVVADSYGYGPSSAYAYYGYTQNYTGGPAYGAYLSAYASPGTPYGLYVANGMKNWVNPDPEDATKAVAYVTVESGENVTYYSSRATLVDGYTVIVLPDHFRKATSPDYPVTVQLTPHTLNTLGLGVVSCDNSKIVVGELMGGKGNFEFDYTVKGMRRGYEEYNPIIDNVDYVPFQGNLSNMDASRTTTQEFYDHQSKGLKRIFEDNGTLDKGGKVNEDAFQARGWKEVKERRPQGAGP